jgi:DNA-directed RNA polymerase subunit RPC12/RpoP
MVDYKCLKCKKSFNSPSKLERHKNIKNPCDKIKEQLKCDICNVKFARPAEQARHEKTDKHINNYNKIYNQDECIDTVKNDDDLAEYNNKIQTLDNIIKNLNNMVNELNNKNQNLNNMVNEMNIVNQSLNNEIKHLNIENQNLKNNQSLHADYESIYIIHPSQYANTNIYKIGRTFDIGKRHAQYPDGSKLLYSFCCKDSKTVENLILDYLKLDKQTFKLMDFGREYFQCDLKDLRNAVLQFID